ncbi:MAG: hypothetical protein WB770_06140, partial [Acidimicrobiales bacterium]
SQTEGGLFRLQPEPSTGSTAGARDLRDAGLRRVRRVSNWTAAALIVGVGVATGELAHAFPPTSGSYATNGATSSTGSSSASSTRLGQAVATSSGSTVAAGSSSRGGVGGSSASYRGDS